MKAVSIPALAALAIVLCTAALGTWQLQRAAEKSVAQQAQDAALAAPPVALGASPVDVDALAGRRIELSGRFEPAGTMLLDNRTHRGMAGFHVLTPLRLEASGRLVMVLRGWVARDVRNRTLALAFDTPTRLVRIEGLALRDLPQPMLLGSDVDRAEPGTAVLQRFDLDAWRRTHSPEPFAFVIRQTSALDDGLVRDWVQPGTSVARHHGYAFQWFAMSVSAAIAWAVMAARGRRRREADARR